MRKLGKKRTANSETVQAYGCLCSVCACASCANSSVKSMLTNGQLSQNGGTIMQFYG